MSDLKPSDGNALSQFGVQIDGLDLGLFTGCEGLAAEYAMEDVQEGGNNEYVYRLPGRVKYTNVKLTRLISRDSAKLAAWFSKYNKAHAKRADGTITLFDTHGKAICRWQLKEVHPVKWTGPSFSTDGNSVAKETLEIAYHGFEWKPA